MIASSVIAPAAFVPVSAYRAALTVIMMYTPSIPKIDVKYIVLRLNFFTTSENNTALASAQQ